MIPDISYGLSWLATNYQTLKGIRRGLERETLRVNINGNLAQTPHPKSLGSPLTHKWITTDFAEAMLELITPVNNNISHMMIMLRDIHRNVIHNIGKERLWPMSIPPCGTNFAKFIKLAQYGNSNIGRMKTLYRKGLKNRYGAMMQIISGVHYNFSLPLTFWQTYIGINNEISGKEAISAAYLKLIRNYCRFGWIIPYLFGASPGINQSFSNYEKINIPFKKGQSGLIYLPYATSLRLSDLGYTNKFKSQLDITFNNLDDYILKLKQAMKTPDANYKLIGLKKDGNYLQLNTNILQNENELYSLIRPKRLTYEGESLSNALMRGGIEYIEIRSLDINPFSPIGIDDKTVYFLDIFLIWCLLAESPEINAKELTHIRTNWNRVILKGRKPGLMLISNQDDTEQPLATIGKLLFRDLQYIAEILDANNNTYYYKSCNELIIKFDNPELTLSALVLKQLVQYGIVNLGLILANKYYQKLYLEALQLLNKKQFDNERKHSLELQFNLELNDNLSFDEFLKYKNYI